MLIKDIIHISRLIFLKQIKKVVAQNEQIILKKA